MIQKWTVKKSDDRNYWCAYSTFGDLVRTFGYWEDAIWFAHRCAREEADKGMVTLRLPENAAGIGACRVIGYADDEPIYQFSRTAEYNMFAGRKSFLPMAMTLFYHHLAGTSDE